MHAWASRTPPQITLITRVPRKIEVSGFEWNTDKLCDLEAGKAAVKMWNLNTVLDVREDFAVRGGFVFWG
ncbi:hypothetical protein Trydic_g20133 [Trypoxylus dichotomus]